MIVVAGATAPRTAFTTGNPKQQVIGDDGNLVVANLPSSESDKRCCVTINVKVKFGIIISVKSNNSGKKFF